MEESISLSQYLDFSGFCNYNHTAILFLGSAFALSLCVVIGDKEVITKSRPRILLLFSIYHFFTWYQVSCMSHLQWKAKSSQYYSIMVGMSITFSSYCFLPPELWMKIRALQQLKEHLTKCPRMIIVENEIYRSLLSIFYLHDAILYVLGI